MIEYRIVEHGSPEYGASIELRDRLLRRPLGLDFSDEELMEESDSLHCGAVEDERVVGILVLKPIQGGFLHLRQLAVDESRQGRGIGCGLVGFAEEVTNECGFEGLLLHAREEFVPFYERLGYACEGERFEEVTIPHRKMRKPLGG